MHTGLATITFGQYEGRVVDGSNNVKTFFPLKLGVGT